MKSLEPAELQAGENILAVSVHQSDPDSSDLSFDIELNAVPKAPKAVVWDRSGGVEAYLWNLSDGETVLEHAASLGGPWQPLRLPGAPAVLVPRRGFTRAAGADFPFGDGTSGFLRARPGAQ